jgi:hypothetical protein
MDHGRGRQPTARWSPLPARTAVPLTALPTSAADDHVVDLATRRAAAEAAVRAVADAPVRHLPAALLDALQGSWGTPEEVLGLRAPVLRLAGAR